MHIFPRICFIRKIPTTPTHKFIHYQTSNNNHTIDGFRNPKNDHLGWKKQLVQNNGRNNMDKLPTSTTGELIPNFLNHQQSGADSTNLCLAVEGIRHRWQGEVRSIDQHWYLHFLRCLAGGGHTERTCLFAGCGYMVWMYECKCRWKIFLLKKYVFSGCYHLFLGWRTEELHINRCMLSVTFQSFRNCSYKLDPRVYGVLSWQPLVSFYLAME